MESDRGPQEQPSQAQSPTTSVSPATAPPHTSSPWFTHVPHPYLAQRRTQGPVKVVDQMDRGTWLARFNTHIALLITVAVGSMWCAYLFTLLALVSFPSAIQSGNTLIIVSWIAQTFLQLVLLPVIIVGQNIQGQASDKRAVQTYHDAEAILHEAVEIQHHLAVQDVQLQAQAQRLEEIIGELRKAYPRATGATAQPPGE